MKKILLLLSALALLGLSACQKVESQAPENDELVICLNASIADAPATRTVYVPDGRKVHWVSGDKLGAKYAAGKDNITMNLKGFYTDHGNPIYTSALFSGKVSGTNNNLAANPSDFVFYYPLISGVGQGGTVTDADNFVLENKFPKVQNSADVFFEANWLYGTAKAQDMLNTLNQEYMMEFSVTMKNLMAVLDFTVKGEGALKRIYVTDLDESAPALWGTEKLTVENGAVKSLAIEAEGTNEYDRTIIAEFNKPVALTAEGAHVYVTVFPRTFAKGLRVGFELANGDYMVRKLAESEGFTLASNKTYTVPELTFASTAVAGKGYYDGVEYSYETITDSRDNNVYKVATLKDGRTWMLENLRYIPDGMTPSNAMDQPNHGLWYPVVINDAGTGTQYGTAADAARFGYNYNYSVAMGLAPDYAINLAIAVAVDGTKQKDEADAELKAQEGKQGICPAGWHVPTKAEYDILYAASGSSLSGLGVQGFIIKDAGTINVNSPTALNPTYSLGGYASNKMNTTYLILSTVDSHLLAKAIMTHVTNNTAAVASMRTRFGAQLRCIKDN